MPAPVGRAVRMLGAVALVAALLAGCTDDGGHDEPAGPTTTAAPQAQEGGTVRLGIGGDLVVDPVKASLASPSDLMVLDLLHDGLTRLDDEGVPQPALATEWTVNDAQTVFKFRMDPNGTFTDGQPITPQVAIASLERVMKAGDTSLAALSLEAVKGFGAFVKGEAKHVSGLTVATGGYVQVELATPLSVLPVVLSNPMLAVVDRVALDKEDLGALNVTGSWAVASADDDGLHLERREGADEHLDGVDVRSYDDDESAYAAFTDGDVDWATVPTSRFAQATEDYGDDHFAPFHAELFFGLNLKSASLANPALRQAIVLAIDRDAIADAVYADLADPLSTVVPAGVPGHDPDRCPECAHDPDTAKDMVAFAFPKGAPTVHIDFDESPAQTEMANLVAKDLEAVGITTELRPQPLDAYKSFVVSGKQELFSFGWIGAYASPDAYLAPLFGSVANDNLTDFGSKIVDRELLGARSSGDPAKNAVAWADAEARILGSWVVVPIVQFRTQVVVADRVTGLEHAVDGTVDWTQVQVTD